MRSFVSRRLTWGEAASTAASPINNQSLQFTAAERGGHQYLGRRPKERKHDQERSYPFPNVR
jgi:hypothetical protein